jgi:outer membrane immunogenic protein
MTRLLFATPFLFLSIPAFAADAVDYEAPPMAEVVSVGDWTGFYAGVQIGGGFGSTGVFEMDRNQDGIFGDYFAAFDPTQPGCAGDGCGFSGKFGSGIVGGIHAGYDWQMGQIVFGGLVDIIATDIDDRQSGFSGTPAFYHIDRDLDWLATARARIGYAFTDSMLAYATGGVAFGNVNYQFVSNTPAIVAVSNGGSEIEVGYTVGGGVEAKMTERISIGLEYLYTNLGSNDFNVNLSGAAGTPAGNAFGTGGADSTNARGSDRSFDFHTVQLKMSYRF